MRRSRAFAAVALSLSVALVAPRARADAAVDQAKALFDGGAAMYDSAHYVAAIQAFDAAYRLAPRPGILFSMAQAHKKQFFFDKNPEHLREALRCYREYVDKTPSSGRRAEAIASIAELEPYTSRVDMTKPAAAEPAHAVTQILVEASAPGLEVTLDGQKAPDDAPHWVVKPGKHAVHAGAPGYASQDREVSVREGEYLPVLFELKEVAAKLSIDTQSSAQVSIDGRLIGSTPLERALEIEPGKHLVSITKNGYKAYSEDLEFKHGEARTVTVNLERTKQRWIAFASFGLGIASAAAGAVFEGLAFHQQQLAEVTSQALQKGNVPPPALADYNQSLGNRDLFKKIGAVAFGGAVVFGGTGLLLYGFDQPVVGQAGAKRDDAPKTPAPKQPSREMELSFSPVIAPGFGGGALLGRF